MLVINHQYLRPFLAIHPKYPRISLVKMNSAKEQKKPGLSVGKNI